MARKQAVQVAIKMLGDEGWLIMNWDEARPRTNALVSMLPVEFPIG
jgi:hypothetical protein